MSKRVQQVNQLIKQELSQIILKELDLPKDVLVTLTRVEVVPNLSVSRVYISCLPENSLDKTIKDLNNRIYDIQQKLNKRLNMKNVPKIIFSKEKETIEAGKIEEILEKLKKN